MTTIAIEKNIPIPPVGRKRARYWRYPFLNMKPGDSFLVPGTRNIKDRATRDRLRARFGNRLCYAASTLKTRYTTRMTEHGLRVWRIA